MQAPLRWGGTYDFFFLPGAQSAALNKIKGPEQYVYWPTPSIRNSGEKHSSTAVSSWPSTSEHRTLLACQNFFFPITCPSKLRFFPQFSLFLLVLQTCTDMKLALNVLGKYPWIPNIFGETEVSLGVRLKMISVKTWMNEWMKLGNVDQKKGKDWNPYTSVFSLKKKWLKGF